MTAQFLLVCAVLVGQASADVPGDDSLKWQSDLATAQRQARESGRIVLIHFGGPWCEPCRKLEQNVFNQPGFGRDLAARYVAVKIDPREQYQLAEKYGVRAVPCDVVTTATGQFVFRVESPATAAAYSATLNRVADNVMGPAPNATQAAPANYLAAATPSAQPVISPPSLPDRHAADNQRQQSTAPSSAPPVPAIAGNSAPIAGGQNSAPPQVAGVPRELPATTEAKSPPFALDRFCPVTLVDKRRWARGSEQWGAIHRGSTYLFVSAEAQKAFLANPDRYSPACAGNDPVLRVEYHQDVPGKREHGAFYNNRIYLFSSEDTFLRFDRNPARYTADVSRQTQRR